MEGGDARPLGDPRCHAAIVGAGDPAPGDATLPAASTINWFQTGTIAANTTVIACSLAKIACYVPPTSSTDIFIDILGYFR